MKRILLSLVAVAALVAACSTNKPSAPASKDVTAVKVVQPTIQYVTNTVTVPATIKHHYALDITGLIIFGAALFVTGVLVARKNPTLVEVAVADAKKVEEVVVADAKKVEAVAGTVVADIKSKV